MKRLSLMLSLLLTCALLAPRALAHSHPGGAELSRPAVSLWARPEVERAYGAGLIPDSQMPDDFSAPLTRGTFRLLAMQYIALQNCSTVSGLDGLIGYYLAEKDEYGQMKPAFSDGSLADSYAYYLGLIEGRGGGVFDPDGVITRQEVAVLLARAYTLCGGAPEDEPDPEFEDFFDIADWARKSVASLAGWGVMLGSEGRFSPEALCTVEQGILLLLRLSENAPVSRANGNVAALFSYEQCLAFVDNLSVREEGRVGYTESLRVEGNRAILVRLETGGVTVSTSSLFMVHRDGGLAGVDLGICNTAHSAPNRYMILENPRFSDDGAFFYCTVTLTEDVFSYFREPFHEKGVYHITVPVDTPGPGIAERVEE